MEKEAEAKGAQWKKKEEGPVSINKTRKSPISPSDGPKAYGEGGSRSISMKGNSTKHNYGD